MNVIREHLQTLKAMSEQIEEALAGPSRAAGQEAHGAATSATSRATVATNPDSSSARR